MTLDLAVARAVSWARLLETALHSRQPWFIDVGGVRIPAERIEHDWGVSFVATFESVPSGADTAVLFEGDSMRAVRPFDPPSSGFEVTWDLSVEEPVSA
jgi:hypothetical protein